MARATKRLIQALRVTALRLKQDDHYQWGHFGACNCGHLAQTLTLKTKAEIHQAALRKSGDWGEISEEYCPSSGLEIDWIISEMLKAGLNLDDIEHLEDLSNANVLQRLTDGRRYLHRNEPADVATYMGLWANLLEADLLTSEENTADKLPSCDLPLAVAG